MGNPKHGIIRSDQSLSRVQLFATPWITARQALQVFITCLLRVLLEKEMATHSSTLAWKIPWIKEPGRLQSMGLQRVCSISYYIWVFHSLWVYFSILCEVGFKIIIIILHVDIPLSLHCFLKKKKTIFFPIKWPWHTYQKSIDYRCVNFFLDC